MPESPAHEKPFVDPAFLDDPVHGSIACVDCHGGDADASTRLAAHEGMDPDPSLTDPGRACGACHAAIAATHANGLHATLRGIRNALEVRAGTSGLSPALEKGFRNHCSACHASCGDCHIAVPEGAGSGLLMGHFPQKTPPATFTCTACHGSRVNMEFKGKNSGIPADVHYGLDMTCTDCHKAAEMHGAGSKTANHRYQVTDAPRCATCHPDDDAFKAIAAHKPHRTGAGGALDLSCQACHAVRYKNCRDCHLKLGEGDVPTFEVNPPDHVSQMALRIGRNPMKDALHPETWVPVRHAPSSPTSFAFYGSDLLPAYASAPTWHLATPHTIRRTTPQNKDCTTTCHANRDVFLGPADLAAEEVEANAGVVVEAPPP